MSVAALESLGGRGRRSRRVVAAYEASHGAATSVGDGEMVDVPVYERARGILELEM